MKRFISILLVCLAVSVSAQNVALKTNVLYDAAATVNLGVEFGLSPKWTMDVSGNLNAWDMSHDRKWKHWLVQPEARYWFCNPFSGHFLGIHAHGGQYNIGGLDNDIKFLGSDLSKLSDSRYEGWLVGAGVAYGYTWILNKHWNFELEIGIGYAYTHFDRYPCAHCGRKLDSGDHHYFGPTKAAINLVYVF